MAGDMCTLWYVDIFDIWQLLTAIHEDRTETSYRKKVTVIEKIPKPREK